MSIEPICPGCGNRGADGPGFVAVERSMTADADAPVLESLLQLECQGCKARFPIWSYQRRTATSPGKYTANAVDENGDPWPSETDSGFWWGPRGSPGQILEIKTILPFEETK